MSMMLNTANRHAERHSESTARRSGRSESDFLFGLKRSIRLNAELDATVRSLAYGVIGRLSARRLLIAAREIGGERAFLWSVGRGSRDDQPTLELSELGPIDAGTYFFQAPPSWGATRRSEAGDAESLAAIVSEGASGRFVEASADFVSDRFAALHLRRACLAVSVAFGSEWECRLFVLDADAARRQRAALRFVRRAANELSPAVYNVYLFHRLQAQVVAAERAALARALHDHVIQSLISAEMRVHAIRRHRTAEAAAAELLNVEKILHEEVLGIRDLMQRIKPIHLTAEELLESLEDHVQKFALDTGIKARFESDVRHVNLPGTMCTEVARVVQEALSNVRKHSGARNVVVRLAESGSRWRLVIEDDGLGLGARMTPSGSNAQMPATKRLPSPTVIKECVRLLHGELKLHSAAGEGLRLEITFAAPGVAAEAPTPQKASTEGNDMAVSHNAAPIMTAIGATVDAMGPSIVESR